MLQLERQDISEMPPRRDLPEGFEDLTVGVVRQGTAMCQSCRVGQVTDDSAES